MPEPVAVAVTTLAYGDIIVEGDKKTVVTALAKGCTRHKIHVNGNACYDRGAVVTAVIGA